jgi:hypothetical protein
MLLQEGLANLCLVGSSTTLVRAKIEANLPRKRGPAIAGYDKAWDKFMEQVSHNACTGSCLVLFVLEGLVVCCSMLWVLRAYGAVCAVVTQPSQFSMDVCWQLVGTEGALVHNGAVSLL